MERPLTLVTKIEYAPLAFGTFSHGMFSFPLGVLLTPKQKIEIIKERLGHICLVDNFSIEENNMLQNPGNVYKYLIICCGKFYSPYKILVIIFIEIL